MKKQYNRPTTEVVIVNIEKYVMTDNSEPEVTYNIGAKPNNMTFDWDDDWDSDNYDLWGNEENE